MAVRLWSILCIFHVLFCCFKLVNIIPSAQILHLGLYSTTYLSILPSVHEEGCSACFWREYHIFSVVIGIYSGINLPPSSQDFHHQKKKTKDPAKIWLLIWGRIYFLLICMVRVYIQSLLMNIVVRKICLQLYFIDITVMVLWILLKFKD